MLSAHCTSLCSTAPVAVEVRVSGGKAVWLGYRYWFSDGVSPVMS